MSGTIDGTAPWCDAGTGESESESESSGQTCEEIRTALEGLVQGIVVISNFKCDISDTCGTDKCNDVTQRMDESTNVDGDSLTTDDDDGNGDVDISNGDGDEGGDYDGGNGDDKIYPSIENDIGNENDSANKYDAESEAAIIRVVDPEQDEDTANDVNSTKPHLIITVLLSSLLQFRPLF